MRSLATVELQLIFQFCDHRSLLSLARCNHFTLDAASAPFAWSASSTIRVSFVDVDRIPLGPDSAVLRHAKFALVWPVGLPKSPSSTEQFLHSVAVVPGLHAIEVQARPLLACTLTALFALERVRQLRSLTLDGHFFQPKHLRQLSANCPQLHTLHLTRAKTNRQFKDLLPDLTALTSLQLLPDHGDFRRCRHPLPEGGLYMCLGLSEQSVLFACAHRDRIANHLHVLDVCSLQNHKDLWPSAFRCLRVLHTLRLDFLADSESFTLADAVAIVIDSSASVQTIEFEPRSSLDFALPRLLLAFNNAINHVFTRDAATYKRPPVRLQARFPWSVPNADDWRRQFEALVRQPSQDCAVFVAVVTDDPDES